LDVKILIFGRQSGMLTEKHLPKTAHVLEFLPDCSV
jgi:hypothetical protein